MDSRRPTTAVQVETASSFHLAQANIARMIAPFDDPVMAGFVEQLDHINSVADRSPGFVWRLHAPDDDDSAARVFGDERIVLNISVWKDLASLYAFTYRSEHIGPLRDRRRWFSPMIGAHLVLWWVSVGDQPDAESARDRFALLDRNGPGPSAFTFRSPFTPEGRIAAPRDHPR